MSVLGRVKFKVIYLIIPTLLSLGCSQGVVEFDDIDAREYFTSFETEQIKLSSRRALDTYRESGISGGIGLVKACYEVDKNSGIQCVVYDLTILMVDREMSRINNFNRDDYFKDEKFLSRAAGVARFADKEPSEIIIAIGKIAALINSSFDKTSGTESRRAHIPILGRQSAGHAVFDADGRYIPGRLT